MKCDMCGEPNPRICRTCAWKETSKAIDLAQANATKDFTESLRRTVNSACTCGGCGPDDPDACPACLVWHRMRAMLGGKP